MERYIKALSGISYSDWKKLKEGVDRVFSHKKSEFEKEIKLADSEMETVMSLIHSQFG